MSTTPASAAAPRIRLLVLDVDGTVTNSRHEVPATIREAIDRIRNAGVGVVLATGRRYRDTLPVAAMLGVEGPLITASGALVKRTPDHVTLARAEFGPGVLEGVVAGIVAAGYEPVLYSDSFADGFDFHCRVLPDALALQGDAAAGTGGLADYLERNRGLARVAKDLHRRPPTGVFAGFAMGPRSAMLDLEESLQGRFPGQLSLHTIRSPRYRDWMCEIAPAGFTKWSGVMTLADQWGIPAEAICAVGDDVNDLPMIRGAGLGIAMGNAQPEVLAAADQIVGSHDDDGLVDVAELILGGQ